jgi:hypothetical protein
MYNGHIGFFESYHKKYSTPEMKYISTHRRKGHDKEKDTWAGI